MSGNTTLTVDKILRATYAVMHQKSNFIMNTNRQYDPEFQRRELKQGQSLRVRLPAKYRTRVGNQMQTQSYVERQAPLTLAIIRGVDLNFGQEELTFSIEDFTNRVIMPAASQLIADVEADAFTMYRRVANVVGVTSGSGSGLDYLQFQTTGRFLSENLAPQSDRYFSLNSESRVTFSDAVKGLFQDSSNIAQQYKEGIMGRTGGFDVFENTLVPAHQPGEITGDFEASVGSPAQSGFDGGDRENRWPTDPAFQLQATATAVDLKAGDVITIEGVFEVHPETKQSLGYLKRFTVTEDTAWSGSGAVPIYPFPILDGAYQNVSAPIADDADITLLGDGDAVPYGQNLAFHKDAFAFVTADLLDPSEFGAWGGRRVEDNLSLRIWRQGDIANGTVPCRLDIAYGFAPIYPEWACRHVHERQQLSL